MPNGKSVSSNHFDVFIPVGHKQLLVETYSDYDI